MIDVYWFIRQMAYKKLLEKEKILKVIVTEEEFWPVLSLCDWRDPLWDEPEIEVSREKIKEWLEVTKQFYKMQKELSKMSGIKLRGELEEMIEDLETILGGIL